MGLSLDEPDEMDKILLINEIQVAIDPNIEAHAQTLTLDVNQEGKALVLLGNESNCC
ncbi:hypothetical protein [Bacillus sp. T3]|uniref:hypothetical protein n=1 Tax=Bacillus sp. T3 TaxID=467262 RepID=UPI0029810824|nr:hypothetical protein [Bacillus sp. T3]